MRERTELRDRTELRERTEIDLSELTHVPACKYNLEILLGSFSKNLAIF